MKPGRKVNSDRPEYLRQYQREYKRFQRANNPEMVRDYHRACTVTLKDGKRITCKDKRPYPETQSCELCGQVTERLAYHHWDDNNPSHGLWLCSPCHSGCELIEHRVYHTSSGFAAKYDNLKFDIANGWNGEFASPAVPGVRKSN